MTLKFFPIYNNRINNDNSIGFNTYYDIGSNEWKSATSFQEGQISSSFLINKVSDGSLQFEAASLKENGLDWSTAFNIRPEGFAINGINDDLGNENKGHGILYEPIHINLSDFVLLKEHNGRLLIADVATTITLLSSLPIGFNCDVMKHGDLSNSDIVKLSMIEADVAIHTGHKHKPFVVFGKETWRFADGKRPKLFRWVAVRVTKFSEKDWFINFGTVESAPKD